MSNPTHFRYTAGMELRWLKHRIDPLEAVGLRPLGRGLSQCAKALAGDKALQAPPAKVGLSAVRQLSALKGPLTWLGWTPASKKTWVLNYFNRTPVDPTAGFDVRITQVQDYRGGQLTYNSHMGTDFVVPVGTRVVAGAPGVVYRVENLMQRGGLKVVLDHGQGLMSINNHLARALVKPGERVLRGQLIGLSGMSSVDGVLAFPWLAPHLHYTTLLAGTPVDPFATEGEQSLWRHRNDPSPAALSEEEGWEPTQWDASAVEESIAACTLPAVRAELAACPTIEEKARAVVYWRYFARWGFAHAPPLTARPYPRRPFLDLPLHPEDCSGVEQR